jgi:hypothetical protein
MISFDPLAAITAKAELGLVWSSGCSEHGFPPIRSQRKVKNQ